MSCLCALPVQSHACVLCRAAAVVLWDLSEVLDDTLTCAYMKQVGEGSPWNSCCHQHAAVIQSVGCRVVPACDPKLPDTPNSHSRPPVGSPSLPFAGLQLLEMCTKDSRLRPYCATSRLVLMGHSRGAKLSCLLAEQVRTDRLDLCG